LLTLLWCIAGLALVLAGAAWIKVRQTAKQFARLSESYWELRYENGQLASRLHLIEVKIGIAHAQDELSRPASGQTAFVPLSSLKKTS
jgi:hypothetical protein